MVLTNIPLRSTIHKPYLFGRMARWALELSEYGIQYRPRLAKKGQVLTKFLAKITQPETCLDSLNWLILSVDGASRQTEASIDLQLKSPSGDKIEQEI